MILSTSFGQKTIHYVALGDSYTIGTGAGPGESWPSVATARLQKKGIPVELTANLGHNGWTAQNVIDGELPYLKQLNPDFVTLLIGTNDWVQGVDAQTFQKNVEYILSQLLQTLPANHILLITVPDFSVTPSGAEYSNGRNISEGLKEFNQILFQEAQTHNLKIVDIFPLSQSLGKDLSNISPDGLHPSAKGYASWADLITPALESACTGNS